MERELAEAQEELCEELTRALVDEMVADMMAEEYILTVEQLRAFDVPVSRRRLPHPTPPTICNSKQTRSASACNRVARRSPTSHLGGDDPQPRILTSRST